MIRILMVTGGPLDFGGISTWLMNYARQMDPERVCFDYLVHGMDEGPREAEFIAMGSRVYHVPYKRPDPAGNRRAILRVFREENYRIVHSHMDGMNAYILRLARQAGIPVRISHCHNTDYLTTNPLRRLLHTAEKKRIPGVATHLLACSGAAASFFYGDRAGEARIVHNAICPGSFAFDPVARARLRREMNIAPEESVLLNVARLAYQKNQSFLLRVTKMLTERGQAVRLLLVGDGEDRRSLESEAESLGIADRVIFAGYRPDAAVCYCAADLFVLPSRFEGLGIVLVEAQANGLPCLASDHVPPDARVTDCCFLPLDECRWAETIAAGCRRSDDDAAIRTAMERAGYDIRREGVLLQSFYEEMGAKV